MSLDEQTNSTVISEYKERTLRSAALAATAREVFPSGITHDSRYMRPYTIYVDQGKASRKWDVDGNEYVDYFGGHGALLLGHCHPQVTAAIQDAVVDGTQFAASTTRELRWGEQVKKMVPSIERVRFTASGTEATHLALRLARAHTGKSKLVRFKTYFHGWHDHMTSGYTSHFDGSPTAGVVDAIAESVILLPPNDLPAVTELLASRDDVAAVIIEPTGASFGRVPIAEGFLEGLRAATEKAGVLLIFDEVISGFRCAPGGAQSVYGIRPDLTTLAKILAGGLPGGAVGGRADIMERLDFFAAEEKGFEKIQHPGTFNANPVSAAAGLTALEIIAATNACENANAYGAELRDRLNNLFKAVGSPFAAYGTFSSFQIFLNVEKRAIDPTDFDPFSVPYQELKAAPRELVDRLRMALMIYGVDIGGWPGGLISAAHNADDMSHTLTAFEKALARLENEPGL
ncbi:aminotransferase class III-fold pyridoxal phosphate-dependent enzyme [Acuticoccus sp. M5D2P5]|uniref:aspartate aminotransferase family protein n=1 Tax=Acuticoccus kalidii TaxID=2910977 RepID=UPI001F454F68|nr:aminotransferase class III-fold pyridoxal phosphate-dependent enzyme [Acuticoccus kalidii]MCF3936218.1 aminotransferase class III-fold pyridoxal phosphate-dependent enzyme [Acuticoccus kalidii]